MTTAARQRREAHRTRLALPRALHQARMGAHSFQNIWTRAYSEKSRLPTISISKGPLRKHRLALVYALLRT